MSSIITLFSSLAIMSVFSSLSLASANMAVPLNSSTQEESTVKPSSSIGNGVPKESQIKEKGKVYRDPYGNRISAPHQTPDSTSVSEEQSASEDRIRPTSSLSLKSTTCTTPENPSLLTSLDPSTANIAIVYFSAPEKVESNDVDVLSGASIVKNEKLGKLGTVEYLAHLINDQVQGKLFAIKRIEDYPLDHDDLVFQAADELDNKARPHIKMDPKFDPSQFDIIFLGYPIWWYDLPMPLYSFFDEYDLSGKTIIPFCTHGGNRPYKTFAIIANSEPNAQVTINSGLIINRYHVPNQGAKLVEKWVDNLSKNVVSLKKSSPSQEQ